MKYKVSVIVPVYKAELYIERCVSSILNQTLDSIEIILIDDGSPDNSGKICDKLAKQNNNIVVFHLENGGPSKARNIGIEFANGEYLGFVDSDDYVEPNMFEVLYNIAKCKQADVTMCSYFIDEDNEIRTVQMNYEEEYRGHDEIRDGLLALYAKRYHNGLYSVCNKLFKKQLVKSGKVFFNEQLIRAEDAWFVFEYLKIADKVCFVDVPLYHYRQVVNSTMHIMQNDRYDRSKIFRLKVIEESENLGIAIQENEVYYEFLYESLIYCRSMIKQHNINKVKEIINDKFFFEACKHSEYLPKHLRLLCFLEKKRKVMFICLLKLWSLM